MRRGYSNLVNLFINALPALLRIDFHETSNLRHPVFWLTGASAIN